MRTHYQTKLNMDMDFGGTTYSPAPRYYLGLSTSPVQRDGSGITEPPTSAGYARVLLNNNNTVFSTTTNSSKFNLIDIEFPEATGSWGTVTHIFLSDAETGGNIRFYEALPTPRNVQINSTIMFKQQTMTISGE